MHLAIDPGRDTGWALFSSDGQLTACGLGDPRAYEKHKALEIESVIIEQPTIYPRSPVPPQDIATLALNAGEWAGLYRQWAPVEYVRPHAWKGSVPKDIHHFRLWGKLSPIEQGVFDTCCKRLAPSKKHNVLDAVGLGLYKLDRYRLGR